MVSLGYKHHYFGSEEGTLFVALGLALRLSSHNYKNLIIMPQDLNIQRFINDYIKNTTVSFYQDFDFENIHHQFFEKFDSIFFISLKPENLKIMLPVFENLKEKEIIITSRKCDDECAKNFDYITKVKRESIFNNNRVIIFTGEGKGKTTGALGNALMGWMRGNRICIYHFLKNKASITEDKALKQVDGFELVRLGRDQEDYVWITDGKPDKKDIEFAQNGLRLVKERIKLFRNSIIVLDEILFAINHNLVSEKDVLDLIHTKHPETYILLTGRGESKNLFDLASKIYTMNKVKHPYDNDIPARKGIEY